MAGRFSVEAVFKAVDRVTAPVSRMQNRVGKFTRGMEAGLRRANRALSKLTKGMANAAKTGLKGLAIGVGSVTTAVGLLVREFSKVEDAQAAFTPLLRGAEKAKQMVDAINETAASTPFQFETLASSVNQLLPVMNGNIENTVKTLRMLGDTAGGNAQKLDSITRGFTKAMLKGKVDMEALNMIAEAGVPIFTELADSMGVKVNAAFFKMISAGKVTTTQLTAAFEKMTSEGGVFFEGMQIASKTTSGLWSTLKDNISLTAAELGSVLAPVVKDLIRGATDVAKRVREWVKNNRELISSRFMEFVENAKTGIMDMVEGVRALNEESNLLERLKTIIFGISDAFSFLREHGATIAKIIAAIVALSLAIKVATIAMAAFNLIAMANPIGLIAAGIVAAAALIIANWEPIKGFFAGLWDGIVGIFDSAVARIDSIIGRIGEKISSITAPVGDFFSGINDFLEGDSLGAFTPAFGGGPQVISPQERTAKTIEEQRTTSTAEVTIRDESGRAEVTGGQLGAGLKLQQTGVF